MVIVGAGGFAKEVAEILLQNNYPINEIVFFDNVSEQLDSYLVENFKILRSFEEVEQQFKINNQFTLGLGNPKIRKKLSDEFLKRGGILQSVISTRATIGKLNSTIDIGCSVMSGTVITSCVTVEEGVILNLNTTVGHDVFIGAYAELCPDVNVSGGAKIGAYTFIGTGAVILPNVIIGENCKVGAGSVVTKHVEDNTTVVGIPAKPLQKK